MSYSIDYLPEFERELRRLDIRYRSMKDDYALLLNNLKANPTRGIDLGDGIRKVRVAIASKDKGKSAGARVITYNVITHAVEGRDGVGDYLRQVRTSQYHQAGDSVPVEKGWNTQLIL